MLNRVERLHSSYSLIYLKIMPKQSAKVRISGLSPNYILKSWLQQALQDEDKPLGYFSFAYEFGGSESKTNLHYNDLLTRLDDKKQSNRLIHLVSKAKATFKVEIHVLNYHEYWTCRRTEDSAAIIAARQTATVTTLNDIACQGIERRAQEMAGLI
ncbi:MAG: hypothetical protein EXX96DRAFT_152547 [Benjaminiella poitrasii]|nr:MAG: hypothetical protein EXX96DRAFT_152547 [Benjaminiella poitrasii]